MQGLKGNLAAGTFNGTFRQRQHVLLSHRRRSGSTGLRVGQKLPQIGGILVNKCQQTASLTVRERTGGQILADLRAAGGNVLKAGLNCGDFCQEVSMALPGIRSEERRVGKEGNSQGRSRWAP